MNDEESDSQWLDNWWDTYIGENLYVLATQPDLFRLQLKDEATRERMLQIAHRYAESDLNNVRRAVTTSLWFLANIGTDEAVEAIAPYLKNSSWSVAQNDAARSLGGTRNSKAVPYLIEALHDAESRAPSLSELATYEAGEVVTPWMLLVVALARIHTDEALAAIEASLEFAEKKYGGTVQGGHLSRVLRESRDSGVRRYQEDQKFLREQAAKEATPTPSSSETSKTSSPPMPTETAPAAVSPTPPESESAPAAETMKSRVLIWLVSLAVAFVAVLGYVFYRRK